MSASKDLLCVTVIRHGRSNRYRVPGTASGGEPVIVSVSSSESINHNGSQFDL